MFRPGEEVVCIDDSNRPDGFDNWITKYQEYTIERCEGTISEGQRVLLEGLKNKTVFVSELGGNVEMGFSVRRFRRREEMIGELEEEVAEEIYLQK